MKKELIISFSIIFVLMAGTFLWNRKPTEQQTSNAISVTNKPTTTATETVTKVQVATHNSVSDCWIILNNNAYNVTSYLEIHPGGSNEIIPYCGKDATSAYNTIKGGRGHSSNADAELPSLLIGAVQ